MQIVFLNTFERHEASEGTVSAQLSICEKEGVWQVHWVETAGSEEQGEPNCWYEGTSWEEMLAEFRYGAAREMGRGFIPIIDGMLEQSRSSAGSLITMQQCYGELHHDSQLFQSLREWRRSAASQEKKSAYLVATNKILWMISAYVPQSEEELMQIPGWGSTKQAAYGEAVLAITRLAERKTAFPLDWVADKLDSAVYTQWLFKQKEQKYKGLMDRHQQKKKLLELLSKNGGLTLMQQETQLPRRELLLRLEQLEQEGYDIEPLVASELTAVPSEEQRRIWEAFASIGDRYLKPVIEEVYGKSEGSDAKQPLEQLYERVRLLRLRFRREQMRKAV